MVTTQALVDYGSLRFAYSRLACAAIHPAASALGKPARPLLRGGYSTASLAPCSAYLAGLFRNAPSAMLFGVYK